MHGNQKGAIDRIKDLVKRDDIAPEPRPRPSIALDGLGDVGNHDSSRQNEVVGEALVELDQAAAFGIGLHVGEPEVGTQVVAAADRRHGLLGHRLLRHLGPTGRHHHHHRHYPQGWVYGGDGSEEEQEEEEEEAMDEDFVVFHTLSHRYCYGHRSFVPFAPESY